MRKAFVTTGVVALAMLAGGAFVIGWERPPAEPEKPTGTAATTALPSTTDVPVAPGEMILGDPDAPVTIVEYASLTCDHCGAFHRETLPRLKAEWLDTGRARLVYRDFPLNAPALTASMVARCAAADAVATSGAEAGRKRYFAFVSAFFQTQESWSHASDPVAALVRVAKLGGLGEERFRACMGDKAVEDAVLTSRLDGERYGIASTPTFFINGQKLEGTQPYAEFETLLNAVASGADG
ncbi:DsbA family protein [Marinivivus vitaminiproducens]|uniref:DsbA family protein n=1 Tax=Marinivivus vitaminiproducens TaxID=3035935 RepID=UPI0027A4A4E2|nr:DsbA family protein [Geminicoccaceae bacterium SCSIO 64248]